MTGQDLKNSILQLAIQGKLVEQLEEEGTAKELIEKIEEEKKRLIKEGKIKKTKPLPEITEDEIPFDIPENWKWVRLGNLIQLISGVSYKKHDVGIHGIRILRGGNIQEMVVSLKDDDVFLPDSYVDDNKLVKLGDVIIVASTGSLKVIGKPGFVDRDIPKTMIGAFLRICRPYDLQYSPFIKTIFESEFYRAHIRNLAQGTNINNIKESYITEFLIPFPPLEEQKRIVAKIQELMPYVDQYDKAYTEVEGLNKKFPEDMQKSILQYAIQGKLVEQRKEDGTAEELYQKIQEEKKKLIKEGKIKKTKPLPEITEDEIPFEIPENWKWVRLGDVSKNIHYGYTASAQEKGNCKLLRITDIQYNSVKWETVPFCNVKDKDFETYGLNNRDIMIARTGGTIGKTYIVESLNDRAVFASYLIRIIPVENINEGFLKKFMESPLYWLQLKAGSMGTGQPNVNGTTLSRLLFPLPPLEEQNRIVEELDKVIPYTNQIIR